MHIQIHPFLYTMSSLLDLMTWDAATNMDLINQTLLMIAPLGQVPETINYAGGSLRAVGVPMADFMKLTKIPIVIYYGDNIPTQPVENPGQEQWRAALAMAKLWTDAVNKLGGDVTLVHLPAIGIKGTHTVHFLT